MADSEEPGVERDVAATAASTNATEPAETAAPAPARRAPRRRTTARKTATRKPAGTRTSASPRPAASDSTAAAEADAKPAPRRRTARKTAARVPKARAGTEPTAASSPTSDAVIDDKQRHDLPPEPVRLVPAPAVERTHDSSLSEFLPAAGTPAQSNTDLTLAAAQASAAAAAARARSTTRTAERPPRVRQPEAPPVRVVGDAVESEPAQPAPLVDDFTGQRALEETPGGGPLPATPATTITDGAPDGPGEQAPLDPPDAGSGAVPSSGMSLLGKEPAAAADRGSREPPHPDTPGEPPEAGVDEGPPGPPANQLGEGDPGHDSAAEPALRGPVAGGDSTAAGSAAHTLSAAGSASAEPGESGLTAASTAADPTDDALEAAAVEYTATREAPARPSAPAPVPASPEAQEARMSRADAPAPRARARHAHLYVTHVDPWSVMKNAFMLAVAIGIVMIVAVMVLWSMLSLSGTLEAITRTMNDIAGGTNAIDAASLFSFSRVVGVAAILALLEIVLLTALATLFAFLYNLSVGVTGGLQVTLTDDS